MQCHRKVRNTKSTAWGWFKTIQLKDPEIITTQDSAWKSRVNTLRAHPDIAKKNKQSMSLISRKFSLTVANQLTSDKMESAPTILEITSYHRLETLSLQSNQKSYFRFNLSALSEFRSYAIHLICSYRKYLNTLRSFYAAN